MFFSKSPDAGSCRFVCNQDCVLSVTLSEVREGGKGDDEEHKVGRGTMVHHEI